ncbi:MAG: FliA/WhiG family RNA polymerase sigma factor [Gemmatimonadetes bacterium]|nr:FliA/WhiG family RNA polymerase sigma factor [Gemmatimonadota bacterium]
MNDHTQLWNRYAAGDQSARQQLLDAHVGLVHFVARQLAAGLADEAEFDELISAGTLGLVGALEHFDAGRGLQFSTFAAPRIRGAMLDELRRQDHVPRSVRRKARDIGGARDQLARELGRLPSDKEIAARLNIDLPTLWRWQGDLEGAHHVSLDRRARHDDEEEGYAPGDLLASGAEDDVETKMNNEQEVALLRDAIAGLKPQERTVLSLYYYEELKLHEIADVLGLTESRVSQIRTKALSRLRTQLAPMRREVA